MIERNIFIVTRYGSMPGFAACPDGAGPYPPVILYMDAPGFREELRNMARRIAARGYYCRRGAVWHRHRDRPDG